MNFLLRMAMMLTTTTEDATSGLNAAGQTLKSTLSKVLKVVLPIIFSVITAVGVVYCVILGVNYAKAEKTETREEDKKRLIGAIVGFGIAIVASLILWILFGTSIFDTIFAQEIAN